MRPEKFAPEVIEELYSQFGSPRKPNEINTSEGVDEVEENDLGELPEMAFYRSCDELSKAAALFRVYPDDEKKQNDYIRSRDSAISNFRLMTLSILGSKELDDNLERTQVIATALKDKDEDIVTSFGAIFPEGVFTEMPLDHDQLMNTVGTMVLARIDTFGARVGIADTLARYFAKFLSTNVHKTFEITSEEEPEEEIELNVEDPQLDITEFFASELEPEEEMELGVAGEWES